MIGFFTIFHMLTNRATSGSSEATRDIICIWRSPTRFSCVITAIISFCFSPNDPIRACPWGKRTNYNTVTEKSCWIFSFLSWITSHLGSTNHFWRLMWGNRRTSPKIPVRGIRVLWMVFSRPPFFRIFVRAKEYLLTFLRMQKDLVVSAWNMYLCVGIIQASVFDS